MEKTVIDCLTYLVQNSPFIPVPTLSNENDQIFQMDPKHGKGTFRMLKFNSSLILILIADFTPNKTLEKVIEVSEKYLEISQFETESSSFKVSGKKLNNVEKGIYYYLNTKKKTYTYCEANKSVKFTKIILTKEYFDTFLKLKYDDFKYEKTKVLGSYLLKTQHSPQLNFIFQQIRESQAEGKILSLYLESKVMEILSIIITRLDEKEKHISVVLTKKDKQNLNIAVSAMKRDLSVHIDGAELSKIALMSPARFQLAFRKYYGIPPYEYLKELRLNRALLLLKNPEYTISAIAEKVGYTHAGHFSKIFKSSYGITPSKYRRMSLNSNSHNSYHIYYS